MKARFLLLIALLASATQVAALPSGWQHVGDVTDIQILPNGVELQAGQVSVRVLAVGESVIRVRLAPDGTFPPDHSWVILPGSTSTIPVNVLNSSEAVEFATRRVKVRIQKSPLQIAFLDPDGNVISREASGQPMAWSGSGIRVWKAMPPDEHYYGLGEKAGPLDRRHRAFVMWNTDAFGWQESTDPLYKSVPFFLALRRGVAYGIYFDNTYRSSFDFGKEFPDVYSFGADGGELDYYFFYGPHPQKVLGDYTTLVGRTPLPPLWTLGYQQCRYSYYPEARVRELAYTFRKKKIPVDVLYLDIDYLDGYRPFVINREYFPNFEDMIADLHEQGFKFISIIDPHLKKEEGYGPYDDGVAADHFIKNPDGSRYVGVVWPGESVFPEFTLERTRRWWGTLYKDLLSKGVDGIWNDMNEPAIFERADKTMPLDTVHRTDYGTTDHREVHNIFGMQMVRGTYEGLRRLRPNERPFVLTRAAFAGAQRYAATWTGDNTSSWNHYRMMVPTLLGLGISGYPFVGADVGGFAGSPPADLLTRWIQLGVFTPLFRNHTMKGSADQEPWVHGPKHEAIRKRYIELRYRLLPYIYTSFEETTRTGLPLMRPLFLEYPEQENLYGNDQQFLFGRDILVAAKLDEMTDRLTFRLPPGEWYDYWTGEKFQGNQVLSLSPSLEELPLYVRGGAILPHQPLVQHTAEAPQGPLTLRVYPGEDCRGSLYLDDGKTFDYTQGEFLRINFACQPGPDGIRITMSPYEGNFASWWRKVRLEVYGVEKKPRAVRVNTRVLTDWLQYDARGRLTLEIPDTPAADTIHILY
ncbi:MAG: glycoside hydrolase family 31 protein [Terriglobia bacterium]